MRSSRSLAGQYPQKLHYYGTVSTRSIAGFGKDLSVPGLTPASFTATGPTKCVKH
jgi:hypothetical protein